MVFASSKNLQIMIIKDKLNIVWAVLLFILYEVCDFYNLICDCVISMSLIY